MARTHHMILTLDDQVLSYFKGRVPRNGESIILENGSQFFVSKVIWYIRDNKKSAASVYVIKEKG